MKINSDSLTVLVLSIILVCMIAYLLIWPPYRTEGYINDSHQTSKQTEFSNNWNGDTNNRNEASDSGTKNIRSGMWCYTDAYLGSWNESIRKRRLQECLDVGGSKRVSCFQQCTNNPDAYLFGRTTPTVQVCFNTAFYPTETSQNKCVTLALKDCLAGCFGLSKLN